MGAVRAGLTVREMDGFSACQGAARSFGMKQRFSRFGGPDLAHMRIRRVLLRMFRDHAEREGLTFYAVARWGGISEPRAWKDEWSRKMLYYRYL